MNCANKKSEGGRYEKCQAFLFELQFLNDPGGTVSKAEDEAFLTTKQRILMQWIERRLSCGQRS